MTTISVAVFRAANNWPLYAAVGNGTLERAGIDARVVHISSSKQQMKGLADGEYDIVHTAADNVVAAQADAVESKPAIFMGGDDGFLSVYSSATLKSFGDLKGKRVGFDSTTSGFAFVLKKVLSVEGLPEGAYSEVVVGGTDLRYRALAAGQIDAAVMTPPHDLLCSTAGFTKLADVSRYLPRYQGVVGACRPGTPPAPVLKQYRAALVEGLRWLKDRNNRTAAVGILGDNLQGGNDLSGLYDSLFSREQGGFAADGAVDLEGLSSVVMLRREFSSAAALRPVSEYLMKI